MKKSMKKLVSKAVKNVQTIKGGNNGYEGRQEVPMEEWVYVAKG